jgi:hypothetical protein
MEQKEKKGKETAESPTKLHPGAKERQGDTNAHTNG